MDQAYGSDGPEAAEARRACDELKALLGVRPAKFTVSQRETARLALLWAEQYLDGYMNAIRDFDKAEFSSTLKQYRQIRAVRKLHFGKTLGEALCERAELVDAMALVQKCRN